MKKKITQLRWFVTMILFVAAMAMPKMAWAEITPIQPSGEGTAESPYQIGTAAELYWFAAHVNEKSSDGKTHPNESACAVLISDITVNENLLNSLGENGMPKENVTVESWTPIGYYIDGNNHLDYKGTFDGKGYSVSGLYINVSSCSEASFIAGIDGGTVRNVAIIDSYFEGERIIGGICGYAGPKSKINNCLFKGTVKGKQYVGGIIGGAFGNLTIFDCLVFGQITATNQFAGICGFSEYSSTILKNCVYNSSLFNGAAITWKDTAGTTDHVTDMTTDEIASGKAAHWLNSHLAGDGIGWYQNIDNGQTNDAYPVLNNTHGVVYASHPCPSSGTFTNNKSSLTELKHSWGENNVCTQCGKTKDVFDLVEGFQKPSQVGDVYQIGTAGELYWFTALVNGLLTDGTPPNSAANAVLTSDITVNTNVLDENGSLTATSDTRLDWIPIGNDDRPYTGSFNGQGHTISGLYVDRSESWYIGLFGYSKGTIKNTSVAASYIKGNEYVGGLCGYARSATIENCHNSGVVSGVEFVGGLCGENFTGVVQLCSNTGKVSSTDGYIGGIVGNSASSVENCYNKGTITCTATTSKIGGICGVIFSKYPISNSYNVGEVNAPDGASFVGVICGQIVSTGHTISNCYYIPLGDMKAVGGYGMQATESQVINVSSKTADEFKRGEVAYLLNNSVYDGTQAWYQNLSVEGGEEYPNLNKSDKGNKTVYAAYTHGESTPASYNNTMLSNFHTHAYDSSASDEANGNHDKSYQGVFNWVDNDDKTNATVTATFTCAVCGKVETREMTASHDDDHTNEAATCTGKGHNYYVASLTFKGTTYTEYYTQEVPALGHDDSGDVTFNSGNKIYEKHCNRDGCDVLVGYYATSDGMVKARYEDGVYKVPIFCLNDGLEYDCKAQYTVESLEYKRMYYDDKWAAVYVPFAIDCSQLPDFMEMAVINNFHEYEQTDGSYNVVLEVKRKTSGTIPALTPCVIRLKTAPLEGVETVTMRFSNAVFSPAADKSIDCSSVTRYYKFSGSLAKIGGLLVDGRDFVLNAGKLYKANTSTVLLPQRWYLSAEDRAGSSTSSAAMLRSISINVIGDSDGDVTGIEDVHVVTEKVTSVRDGIFDLQGRRLNSEPTNGIYIKNGVKYVK